MMTLPPSLPPSLHFSLSLSRTSCSFRPTLLHWYIWYRYTVHTALLREKIEAASSVVATILRCNLRLRTMSIFLSVAWNLMLNIGAYSQSSPTSSSSFACFMKQTITNSTGIINASLIQLYIFIRRGGIEVMLSILMKLCCCSCCCFHQYLLSGNTKFIKHFSGIHFRRGQRRDSAPICQVPLKWFLFT